MSRPLRINYAGAWYHVHDRSLSHRPLFPDENLRKEFFALIQDISDVYAIEIHAWCLLDSEFHLLVRTPEPRLSEAMRHLLSQYSTRYNRQQKTEGPIFKGRYKSILIENDIHVVQASRYIHRLPRQAAIDEGKKNFILTTWRWSSYLAYIARNKPTKWLHTKLVLHFFAQNNGKAIYQIYVETGQDLETDSFYGKKRIAPVMGSGHFKRKLCLKQEYDMQEVPDAKLLSSRPEIVAIIKQVSNFFGVDKNTIIQSRRGRSQRNIPRSIAIALCRNIGGYSLKEIAKVFGVSHYSSISVAIRRLKLVTIENDKTRHDYEMLKSQIAV